MTAEDHYPLVQCEGHGLVPGYAVCVHVFTGTAAIAAREEPGEELGTALCAACAHADTDLSVDDLRLVCARCFPKLPPVTGAAE